MTERKGRHLHLDGDGVRQSWERMKARKRASIVDGLPADLPPLHRAFRLQDRAAAMGFDWPDTKGPGEKVEEQLAEVRAETGTSEADGLAAPWYGERHGRL